VNVIIRCDSIYSTIDIIFKYIRGGIPEEVTTVGKKLVKINENFF